MNLRLNVSGRRMVDEALRALARFPLAVAGALIVLGAMLVCVEGASHDKDWQWECSRWALAAGLAVPLGVGVVVWGESRGVAARGRWLMQLVGGACVWGYGWLLPEEADAVPHAVWLRTLVLMLMLHGMVAIGPRHGSRAAFWTFNWTLFVRYWAGVLYAVVFYAGLALALVSAVRLFEITMDPKRYFQLWLMVTLGFHPLYVLAGVPRVAPGSQSEEEPARGLRIFAGGVLVPLVALYVAILYPYAVKIAVAQAWPNGWVAAPVIGLAVAGWLAVLLVQPLAIKGLDWAAWFTRWFARLLVPLAGLLGLAVWVRVSEYGLTESRYVGYVLAGWLAVMGLYFGTGDGRSRVLRIIPVSLVGLCVVVSVGPWSMLAVAERSQVARLDKLFGERGLMIDGRLTPRAQTVSDKDFESMRSVLGYLYKVHRSEALMARLGTWRAESPSEKIHEWSLGQDLLTWLKVSGGREDMRYRHWVDYTAKNFDTAGFTQASYLTLGKGYKEAVVGRALGLSVCLRANEGGMEWRGSDGVWEPLDKLNKEMQADAQAGGRGHENKEAAWMQDVILQSGERRRIVVLNIQGNMDKSSDASVVLSTARVVILAP